MLRAAELARERRSLEQLLEDNQARLDTILRGSSPPDPKDASMVSLLQSEMAGQRERLQEIIFLEQNYRQVASPVTEQFCATCNRVRLSSTGMLHTCLARDEQLDLRTPLRAGTSAADLAALLQAAVAAKSEHHDFQSTGCGGPKKHMVSIGG